MAAAVPLLYADVGAPVVPTVFASDAQGAGELAINDKGGFGIVARDASLEDVHACYRTGFRPGRTITSLDGSFGTRRLDSRALLPTVPFS